MSALSLPEQEVHFEYSGTECFVFTRHVEPLVLILCEIFLNAMKYAHPANVPLRMRVGCHGGSDGMLVVEAEDDGVGVPEDFDLEKDGGLGFRVIRSLVTQIGIARNRILAARPCIPNRGAGRRQAQTETRLSQNAISPEFLSIRTSRERADSCRKRFC